MVKWCNLHAYCNTAMITSLPIMCFSFHFWLYICATTYRIVPSCVSKLCVSSWKLVFPILWIVWKLVFLLLIWCLMSLKDVHCRLCFPTKCATNFLSFGTFDTSPHERQHWGCHRRTPFTCILWHLQKGAQLLQLGISFLEELYLIDKGRISYMFNVSLI